jgi:hypothetical protein
MLQRCGRDLTIGHIEGLPGKLPLPFQNSPPLGNRSRDRQNASEKEVRQVGFNPRFELIPSLSRRPQNYAFAKLAEADGTDEQSVEGLRGNPGFDQQFRLGPYQFRCNIGVQQKTTHSKSTGRAKGGCG